MKHRPLTLRNKCYFAHNYDTIFLLLSFSKVFEIRDVEEFTEEWLKEKLRFFR